VFDSSSSNVVLMSRNTPLAIVLKFASKCYFGNSPFSLPGVVKLIIDAGGDVNEPGDSGESPLEILIDEVGPPLFSLTR